MTQSLLTLAVIALVSCHDTRRTVDNPPPNDDFTGQWVMGDRLFPDDSVHLRLDKVGTDGLRGSLRMHGRSANDVSGKIDGQRARIDIIGTDLVFLGEIRHDTLDLLGAKGTVPRLTLVRAP